MKIKEIRYPVRKSGIDFFGGRPFPEETEQHSQ